MIVLSGPVTYLLEELDLINDSKLLAVTSMVHLNKDFKGKRIMGGVFLAPQKLQPLKAEAIFFDQSKELEKRLASYQEFKSIEIKTRNLDPFETTSKLLEKISPYLNNCQKRVVKLRKKLEKIKQTLVKSQKKFRMIFYLGKIGNKKPDMIIVNDGFVKFMKEQLKLESYPSDLAYVSWSSKVMNQLKGFWHIGLHDSQAAELIISKIDKHNINSSFRGVFTPGITQVYYLEALLKYFNP